MYISTNCIISTTCFTHIEQQVPRPKNKLSIFFSTFELRETGDWDIFLGPPPPERARAETGGADHGVKAKGTPRVSHVNKVTSASMGYPLSVFNKNSTLKVFCAPFQFN